MIMKRRKLTAFAVGIAIAGTICTLSASAEASASDFLSVLNEKPADTFVIVQKEETVYPDQVGTVTSRSLQGLAVTCNDPDAVKENGIGSLSVVWSDGIWSGMGIPQGACRMQPLAGFAECYGKTGEYEYVSGSEYVSYSISDDFAESDDTIYLLTMPLVLINDEALGSYWAQDYSSLLDAVLADEQLHLLGAVYGTQARATIYSCGGDAVIKLTDGVETIPEQLKEYGSVEPYYSGYYLLEHTSTTDGTVFSDMMDLCAQISEIDGVEMAYPAGGIPESTVSDGLVGFGIELLAYETATDEPDVTTTDTTAIPPKSDDNTTTETTTTVLESENISTTTETTTTVLESENISTTTETTTTVLESDQTDLPQTGNNSKSNLFIAIGAFLLIGAGTGAVYKSGSACRKKDGKA